MNVPVPRPGARSKAFPALLQRAGKAACLAADEFFAAQISNPPTHRAYARPGIAFSLGAGSSAPAVSTALGVAFSAPRCAQLCTGNGNGRLSHAKATSPRSALSGSPGARPVIVSLNRGFSPRKDPGWTAGTSRSGGECGRTGGTVGPCPIAGGAVFQCRTRASGLHAFREFVQHVQEAVIPASLFCRLRPDFRHSRQIPRWASAAASLYSSWPGYEPRVGTRLPRTLVEIPKRTICPFWFRPWTMRHRSNTLSAASCSVALKLARMCEVLSFDL